MGKIMKEKRKQQFIAFVMAFMMVVGSLPLGTKTASAASTVNLVQWGLPAVTDSAAEWSAYPSTGEDSSAAITLETTSGECGGVNKSNGFTTKGVLEGDAYVISFNSEAYESLTLTASLRASATGARDFELDYKASTGEWIKIADSAKSLTSTSTTKLYAAFALPEELKNVEKAYLRVRVASATAQGGKPIGDAGSGAIGNITIAAEAIPGAKVKAAKPIASIPEGRVTTGTEVVLSSTSTNATVYYGDAEATILTEYTAPISITGSEKDKVTIYAQARGDNFRDSDIVSLTYEIKPARVVPTVADPIAKDVAGAEDIKTAQTKTSGEVTVVGQVAYAYADAKAGALDSVVLQDVIDGEVMGISIKDTAYAANIEKYKIGDIVKVKGTASVTNGLTSISNAVKDNITTISTGAAAFEPQVLTIQELQDYSEFYLSEYVKIKGITLGKYAATGNTPIEDVTGNANLYRSAALPTNMVMTDTASILGVWSKAVSSGATTYSLRNGTTETSFVDYTKIIKYNYTIQYYFDDIEDDAKKITDIGVENTKITATSYADKTYELDVIKTPSLEFTLLSEGYAFKVYYRTKPSEPEEPIDQGEVIDPVEESDIPQGVLSLNAAKEATIGTKVTVIGQLAYSYGINGTLCYAVLQDVIDNEIVGLQVASAMTKFAAGDVITVTGMLEEVNGVRQLSYTGASLIKKAAPLAPQMVTIQELSANSANYLSEYIRIKDISLGTYDKESALITDNGSNAIEVYKPAAYPSGVSTGNKVDFYGIYTRLDNTRNCLRNGVAENSWVTKYRVNSEIVLPIANWEGSSLPEQVKSLKVNADARTAGDELDENSSISVSTGKAPDYTNTSANPKEYYIGYSGLINNDYYQLETTASKYGNVNLEFQMRGSGTGPKNFEIQYSTDGSTYKNSANISYNVIKFDSTQGTTVSTEYKDKSVFEVSNGYLGTVSVDFPSEVNHAAKLYVRIKVTATSTSLNGAALKNTSGVNRFVHIKVSGSPLVGDDICGTVGMDPKSSAVALNETIRLIPSTMGSTIYYSVNSSPYEVYAENNKPVAAAFPCVISAYAVKKDRTKSIKITEKYSNAQTAAVRFSPNGGSVVTGSAVKLACATKGAAISYSTDNGGSWVEYKESNGLVLNNLPVVIMAKATCTGYLDSEVKTVRFGQRSNTEYEAYYGQIHSHTGISDGSGTIEDAYQYASTKAEQIDYLVVTDHSNLFDNDTSATMTDGSKSTEWVDAHKVAKKYTSDRFVGLYGYEMTWSGGAPGHMNTYNTDGFLSRNMTGYKNGSTESLPNYYAQLKTVTNSISQFNHPGNTFGDFYDFSYYDEEIDTMISLIEVGNGEGAVGSSGYFPSYEYYTRALDKGWHIAPTNNQDNHKGRWGDANTGRTVILADSLTEDNIYDALRNMRVYATEDNNLKIKYTLNDEIMGTILPDQPDNIKIAVDLEDANKEAIGKVEVIVNGGLSVASQAVSENKGKVVFNLNPDYSYYYIRVTQADGDIAVTSPVWTASVESIGISSISTTAKLAVKGEEIDVDTTLFNNEQDDFIVSSMEYSVGDAEQERIIHQVNLKENPQLQVVGKGQTPSYHFKYAHNELGTTNINVILKGTYKGVEKTYRGILTLKYTAPEMVTNIVIDGTHDNDYVTGYSAGKLSNLVGIAASKFAKVLVEETEITDATLANCNLLILSSPDRNTSKSFQDSFIATIKKYIERGGSVILCGAADKADNSMVQSSTEFNRLLEAIGATTRLNSDQLLEETSNSLNFTAFNIYSKYAKGLVKGQRYSAYNSCSVLLNETAVAEGKAEAIVYANEATKSVSNNAFGTNVAVEVGKAIALAQEQIGKGSVFVAGAVFVSDYEIEAEVDYAGQLNSMNRSLFETIVTEKKSRVAVTDIATVRKAGMNEPFAIEGYVTAGTAVPGNAFFDTIYVQDDTAGITVFPIAEEGIAIGQKLRIEGFVDAYQGDKEIQIFSYELLDGEKRVYDPMRITTEQAGNYAENGGRLVRVSGEITQILRSSGIVQYIYVQDSTGKEAIVFIDGYILASNQERNEVEELVIGGTVSATGLVYEHPENEKQQVCLRVRDRSEINKSNIVVLKQKVASAAAIDISACTPTAQENLQTAIRNAQAAIDRNETNPMVIDECIVAIEKAINTLWIADYTAVFSAIALAAQVDRTLYTRESLMGLDMAVSAVVMNKNKAEQGIVNAYAEAIYKAITILVYKDADYKAVDAAIQRANEFVAAEYTQESWLVLTNAISAVTRGKNIKEQATVDAYAAAIEAAIIGLKKEEGEPIASPTPTPTPSLIPDVEDKEDVAKKPGVVVLDEVKTVKAEITTKAVAAKQNSDGFFYGMDGEKLTGTIVKTDNGKRYIVDSKGEKYVLSIVTTKEGVNYIVNKEGAVITGNVVETNGKRYYTTKGTGKVVANQLIKINGTKYYATTSGALATGKLISHGKDVYYTTKKSGKIVTNQLIKINGKKYFAVKSGKLVKSKWVAVDGKEYYCGKDGVVTKTRTK